MGMAYQNQKKAVHPKAKQMHWLHRRSTLSIEGKFPLYKAVFKPIWNTAFSYRRQPPVPALKYSSVSDQRFSSLY
jgi:hypothetical protein